MPEKNVNQNVRINIFRGPEESVYSASDQSLIRKVVRDKLLLKSMKPYHKAQVVVKHRPDGAPESLIAFLLRAHTYTADVAKVTLGAKYAIKNVKFDHVPTAREINVPAAIKLPPIIQPKVPVQFVFGTPVPEILTAKQCVETLYKLGVSLGYKCVKLLGPQANLANYKKYLSGHLLGFVNVGHGNTSGIAVADGFLSSSWFTGLKPKSLLPEVVYFNSCQTFNPPLLTAVVKAGRRTYVAGKVNLLIGPSEDVCKCFWAKILIPRFSERMGRALVACEGAKYPNPNSHGISGDTGKFKPIP
ncbi:MAG: hypothetical protein HY964_10290 [Ignavibacteriales bacterium]|nr:hypothetical protein [Ignavibacteriales bacterium]